MVDKFFDKKSTLLAQPETLAMLDKSAPGGAVKNENMLDKELTDELRKPVIRKAKKRKVYSSFIDNIWDADLADMPLISKSNKIISFLCVFDIFRKYAWVIFLKD